MKGIQLETTIKFKEGIKNNDASAYGMEKTKGFFVLADGTKHRGFLSNKWAQYLCDQTPVTPIKTIKGLEFFINDIWESFYDQHSTQIKDVFQRNIFEKQGSFTTYTACWLEQKNDKTYYRWLSYGNSTVLVYDTKKEELFVPDYNNSLLGFLENKGLINWKEEQLDEAFLLTGGEKEFHKDLKIILATDAMAEHLALSYLILKSKDDDYWQILSDLMQTDEQLSTLIYKNRGAFLYNTFEEVLEKWRSESKANTEVQYIKELQQKGIFAKDDVILQVISFDPEGKEFLTRKVLTKVKPVVKSKTVKTPVKVPLPKVKKKPEFKFRKDEYLDILLDHHVTRLYHFTDRSNLSMIKKMGGLYSWDYMERNDKEIPIPGGDHLSRMLDARYGLENYVRTSFCKNHPMMHVARKEGRIPDPVVLTIDPVIVTWYDTIFSDMNATKNGHKRGRELEDLERIKFNVCMQRNHFNLDEYEKPYYQAEVMVKEFIPIKYIMNINQF